MISALLFRVRFAFHTVLESGRECYKSSYRTTTYQYYSTYPRVIHHMGPHQSAQGEQQQKAGVEKRKNRNLRQHSSSVAGRPCAALAAVPSNRGNTTEILTQETEFFLSALLSLGVWVTQTQDNVVPYVHLCRR